MSACSVIKPLQELKRICLKVFCINCAFTVRTIVNKTKKKRRCDRKKLRINTRVVSDTHLNTDFMPKRDFTLELVMGLMSSAF